MKTSHNLVSQRESRSPPNENKLCASLYIVAISIFSAEERSSCQTDVRSQVLLNEPRKCSISLLSNGYRSNIDELHLSKLVRSPSVRASSAHDAKVCGSESSIMGGM